MNWVLDCKNSQKENEHGRVSVRQPLHVTTDGRRWERERGAQHKKKIFKPKKVRKVCSRVVHVV